MQLRDFTPAALFAGFVSSCAASGAVAVLSALSGAAWWWILAGSLLTFFAAMTVALPRLGQVWPRDERVRIDCYPRRGPTSRYVAEILDAGHVFVLWNTGSILRDQGSLGKLIPSIDRFLLPHPKDNPTLESLALAGDRTPEPEAIRQKIRDVTKDIQAQGKDVRWWRGQTGNLLTITSEWIEVEQFTPFVWAEERPTYRLEKRTVPDLYKELREAYDRMWKESEPADTSSDSPA